jgi:hypothetical protein
MQRRKFIAGLGSLAAAGAAGIGTGAFTNVSATRTVNVSTTGDTGAYLQMDPSVGANSTYSGWDSDGDEVVVNLDSVNKDAKSNFYELFQVTNQGTQDVVVYVNPEPGNGVTPVSVTAEAASDNSSAREFPSPGSGDGDVYIDPQATGMPNEGDTFSLTGVYGSSMPYKILNDRTSIDPSTGTSNSGNTDPGTSLSDRVLGVGQSFTFGLNVQHAEPASFPDDISVTLSADAELTP